MRDPAPLCPASTTTDAPLVCLELAPLMSTASIALRVLTHLSSKLLVTVTGVRGPSRSGEGGFEPDRSRGNTRGGGVAVG